MTVQEALNNSPRLINNKKAEGNSESFLCGWTADLFPHPCGSKNGKSIKDSAVFRNLRPGKNLSPPALAE